MKSFHLSSLVCLFNAGTFALAGIQDLFPRQATAEQSTCRCPPPQTTLYVIPATSTTTVTVTTSASGTFTNTVGGATVTTRSTSTFTSTVTAPNTVTTCIISAFKRQASVQESSTTSLNDLTSYSTSTSVVTETVTVTYSRVTTRTLNTLTVRTVPVTTVTTTLTPTYISCPTPTATCNNQGIRFAAYKNTNSAGANNVNTDSTYSTFNPAIIKNRTPFLINTTTTLGGQDYVAAGTYSIYNSSAKYASDYVILNHVGYIFAQVTGRYTFSLSKSDDISMLWVGPTAQSGWTRANANAIDYYQGALASYGVNFTAGTYHPFRIIFGNAQQASIFDVTLTAPDGRVVLTSNSKPSPYLVQYSCDGTSAPPFAAFGSET